MKTAGWSLIGIGAALLVVSWIVPTAVPSSAYGADGTLNIGLLQRQNQFFLAALAAAIAGCVLLGAAHVGEAIRPIDGNSGVGADGAVNTGRELDGGDKAIAWAAGIAGVIVAIALLFAALKS